MNKNVFDTLLAASRTGEVVKIIYRGGTQPGTVREISPVSVSESEIQARDMTSGIVKRFNLSKIELADDNTVARPYDPNAIPQPEPFQSIESAFGPRITELEKMGWYVTLAENGIALRHFFKNGKPLKSSDISLTYDEFIVEQFYDPDLDDWVTAKHPSARPYQLVGTTFRTARTFKSLSSAMNLFMEEARINAPSNAP